MSEGRDYNSSRNKIEIQIENHAENQESRKTGKIPHFSIKTHIKVQMCDPKQKIPIKDFNTFKTKNSKIMRFRTLKSQN